jgi:hypothetical protein
LGHIISTNEITFDPKNIESVRGWKMPRNVIKVRSFMGLAGYYQRFIKRFSNIASPITYLQKKGVKFEWNSKCEERFQQLKDILTSAPILKIVDPDKYFLVCTNECKEGLDGFLTQKDHVVRCE